MARSCLPARSRPFGPQLPFPPARRLADDGRPRRLSGLARRPSRACRPLRRPHRRGGAPAPRFCRLTAPEPTRITSFMNDNHIDETELARLGIKRVRNDAFLWGEYRYGNARDAIAAARRGE